MHTCIYATHTHTHTQSSQSESTQIYTNIKTYKHINMETYKHKMTHVRYQRQINLWITQHYMLGHPQENVDGTDGTAGTVLFVLHGTALHCIALHCTALTRSNDHIVL